MTIALLWFYFGNFFSNIYYSDSHSEITKSVCLLLLGDVVRRWEDILLHSLRVLQLVLVKLLHSVLEDN